MAIVAQCTNCGKKYKVADTSVGKQVRCQACKTTFVVKNMASKPSNAGATSSIGSGSAGQQTALIKKFGLAPLPNNDNAIFPETPFKRPAGRPDPLANHVVYDPGFAPVSVADYHATQMPKEQSMHDYMKQIEEEEGYMQKSSESVSPKAMYMLMGIGPLACALLGGIIAICGAPSVGFWVYAVPDLVIAVLVANIFIWNAIVENDDITQALLCWFVPFYAIYYVATNWDHMMHPVLASILGGISSGFAFALFLFFAFLSFLLWGAPENAMASFREPLYILSSML